MCGITGLLAHAPLTGDERASVVAMIDLMARRGPDSEGLWFDDHADLGFRRLAIIDPSPAGDQPMVSPDGAHVLVFNGEVYNYRELGRELEGRGVVFRSRCDTEVVLHALRVWEDDALGRFNGMFAFAWYDTRERSLRLARDPLGIKPLYYLEHRRGLVFGSQYDQVARHPWCARSVRDDVLGLYLRMSYVPAPYGLFEDTAMLEPGHVLDVSLASSPRLTRYYDPPTPAEPLLTGADAVESVGDAVEAAVRRQLVSDVPLGSLLSGGVDSPLVSAYAQQASPHPLPAFTIGSSDPRFDESIPATAYARALGAEHHLRIFRPEDAVPMVSDVAAAYSEPFADYSAFPSMLVSSVAHERVKAVLSGDGGDELFWGYPRFQTFLGARRLFAWPRAVRALAYAAARLSPSRRLPRGVLLRSPGDWYLISHSWGLRPKQLARFAPGAVSLPAEFDRFDLEGTPAEPEFAEWMRQNELWGHLQMILLKMDRASMYYGLEVRVPLLDLEVVEASSQIDPGACIGDGTGKVPLRHLLGRFVPPETIPREKRGFSVPLGDWLRRELRPQVQDLLLDRDPYPAGAFDRNGLRAFCHPHLQGSTDRTRPLWNLLALQLWADQHCRPLEVRHRVSPRASELGRP